MPYLIALLLGAQMITLIPSHTSEPTTVRIDAANVETWAGGTLVYAHEGLAGAEFYTVETVTAMYSDGSTKLFEVSHSAIITEQDWNTTIFEYSSPETITLVTCYPKHADDTSMRLIVELTEVYDENAGYELSAQAWQKR